MTHLCNMILQKHKPELIIHIYDTDLSAVSSSTSLGSIAHYLLITLSLKVS